MNDTSNPLDELIDVTAKFVIAGFAYTEDACKTDITPGLGEPGTIFSGAGCGKPAIVIVNEFKTPAYTVDLYESEFNYYSVISPTSTQMLGQIRISDKIGGQFPSFIRDCAKKLGVSQTHIAFSIVVFFTGYKKNGESVTMETIVTKPLIFNMAMLTQSYTGDTNNYYTMLFLATYNTFGLMPTFSKMYQHSITNKNGNPSQEIPTPDVPMSTIIPRGAEDSMKAGPRKARIDKSKTMETLGDAFDSLAEDLMQQKNPHQRQLQEWLSYVRDDYVKKISKPQQQKPGGIPVDYRLTLDGALRSYKIDNRNMPFEQPEQSQEKYGVRTIPVNDGEHLINFVEKLMKYSRQLSLKAKTIPRQSFKSVMTILRRCQGKYDAFLTTYQINLPANSPDGIDTGPGESKNPLTFEYQKAGLDDKNVESLTGASASIIDMTMLEQQIDDADAEVVFGNREQSTAERVPQVDFFNSLFSGIRPNINNQNNGLESGEDGGYYDNHLMSNINAQPNHYKMIIRCNPNLLSDLSRNPYEVVFGSAESAKRDCFYYPQPEKHPMYAKLKIYLSSVAASLGIRPDDSDNVYYYIKYYHLFKVKTSISGNNCVQELTMIRADDTT